MIAFDHLVNPCIWDDYFIFKGILQYESLLLSEESYKFVFYSEVLPTVPTFNDVR